MPKIGWDDQGDSYTYWDRIRDERREERQRLESRLAYVKIGESMANIGRHLALRKRRDNDA